MSVFPSLQAKARGVRPSCPTLLVFHINDCDHHDEGTCWHWESVWGESWQRRGSFWWRRQGEETMSTSLLCQPARSSLILFNTTSHMSRRIQIVISWMQKSANYFGPKSEIKPYKHIKCLACILNIFLEIHSQYKDLRVGTVSLRKLSCLDAFSCFL